MQQKRGIRQERSHSNRRNTKLQPRESNLRFKIGLITSGQSILRSRIGPLPIRLYWFGLRTMYAALVRVHFSFENWTRHIVANKLGLQIPHAAIVRVHFTFENWTDTNSTKQIWFRIRNASIAGVHFTIQNWTLTIGAVHFTIENWTQPDRNTFSFIYKRTKWSGDWILFFLCIPYYKYIL